MKIIDYSSNQVTDAQIEDIGAAGTGYNAPRKVRVNGVVGFRKKSINCPTFDKFEYLIAQLGKMLGINVADTFLFDDGSIFSRSVYEEGEEFLTGEDLLKYVDISDQEVAEKRNFDSSLTTIEVNGKKKYVAQTPEEIDYAVTFFIRIINKMNINNKEEIIRGFIRMLFLDILTGNKDRVFGNYGLIKHGNDFSFAPLFDNSTISYPNIDDRYVQLNNYLIDRNSLYVYLLTNYSNYLRDIFDVDKDMVIEKMKELSDRVFFREEDLNNKKWFEDVVLRRLSGFLSSENLTSGSNSDTIQDGPISM